VEVIITKRGGQNICLDRFMYIQLNRLIRLSDVVLSVNHENQTQTDRHTHEHKRTRARACTHTNIHTHKHTHTYAHTHKKHKKHTQKHTQTYWFYLVYDILTTIHITTANMLSAKGFSHHLTKTFRCW